jgi:hypothetical protein
MWKKDKETPGKDSGRHFLNDLYSPFLSYIFIFNRGAARALQHFYTDSFDHAAKKGPFGKGHL